MLSHRFYRFAILTAVLAWPLPAAATLIMNGSFEDHRQPPGPRSIFSPDDNNVAGASAADVWTLFNNHAGTTTSELVATTLPEPGAGSLMMHITTNNTVNGLLNVFLPLNTGPSMVVASAWVYVNRGVVGIGTGNGGNTSLDAFSTTTGQWELLTAPNGRSPANEFIVYSSGVAGADFFVDLVTISAVPEPSTLVLVALGLGLISARGSRGRRADRYGTSVAFQEGCSWTAAPRARGD